MRASPALLRARAPYLLKNTITGFAICSLVIGICMLSKDLAQLYTHCSQTHTPSTPSLKTSSKTLSFPMSLSHDRSNPPGQQPPSSKPSPRGSEHLQEAAENCTLVC